MSDFEDLKKEIYNDIDDDPDHCLVLDEGENFIEYEDLTSCG